MTAEKPKLQWFVYCAGCGEPFAIMPATDSVPVAMSWRGPCPVCGTEHTYRPDEMHLGTDEPFIDDD
jgi:hypothetical protein